MTRLELVLVIGTAFGFSACGGSSSTNHDDLGPALMDLSANADGASTDMAGPLVDLANADLAVVPATWTAVTPPAMATGWSLNSVSFPSTTVGWASGNTYLANKKAGVILKYESGAFSNVDLSAVYTSTDYWLPGISFPSTTESWAAGTDTANSKGFVLHYSAGAWTTTDLSALVVSASWYLHAISMATATDGWAVGTDSTNSRGVILHYHAGAWTTDALPTVSASWHLNRVQALSATEAYAVGRDATNSRGALLHYMNGTWSTVDVSALAVSSSWDLWSVSFASSTEGWAGGYDYSGSHNATMLRFHGGVWSNASSPPRAVASTRASRWPPTTCGWWGRTMCWPRAARFTSTGRAGRRSTSRRCTRAPVSGCTGARFRHRTMVGPWARAAQPR